MKAEKCLEIILDQIAQTGHNCQIFTNKTLFSRIDWFKYMGIKVPKGETENPQETVSAEMVNLVVFST